MIGKRPGDRFEASRGLAGTFWFGETSGISGTSEITRVGVLGVCDGWMSGGLRAFKTPPPAAGTVL
jgi:hypothetical protein